MIKKGAHLTPTYINDMTVVIAHEDFLWFCKKFKELGALFGLQVNADKQHMLTGILSKPVSPRFPNDVWQDFDLVLEPYTAEKGENTQGVEILGTPLGSSDYVRSYAADFLDMFKFKKDAASLVAGLKDPQMMLQVYARCLAQCAPFHLTADVLDNALSTHHRDVFDWDYLLASRIEGITNGMLEAAAALPAIPKYAAAVARASESIDGLGILSSSLSVTASFVTPLIRSICYAERGLEFCDGPRENLPHAMTQLYKGWRSNSPIPMFRTLQQIFPGLAEHMFVPKDALTTDRIEYLVLHKPLGDLQHELTSRVGLCRWDSLLDDLGAFLEFAPSIDMRPQQDNDDGDLDFALDWDITPPQWRRWTWHAPPLVTLPPRAWTARGTHCTPRARHLPPSRT